MGNQRGLTFDQFAIGDCFASQARTVTEAEFGKSTPIGERIAHGMLVVSMATGMANWTGVFEGTTIALMEQLIRYRGVVRFGDTVHLELEVLDKKETSKPDRGVVRYAARVLNQKSEVVVDGEWTLLMRR
jgi:acyl dehydratase